MNKQHKISLRELDKIRKIRFSNCHEIARQSAINLTRDIFQLLNRGGMTVDGLVPVQQKDNLAKLIAKCLLVDKYATTIVMETVEQIRREYTSVQERYRQIMQFLQRFCMQGHAFLKQTVHSITERIETDFDQDMVSQGVLQIIYLNNLLGRNLDDEFLVRLGSAGDTILKIIDTVIEELYAEGEDLGLTEFNRLAIHKYRRTVASSSQALGLKVISYSRQSPHQLYQTLLDYQKDRSQGAISCVGTPWYSKRRLSEKICRWISEDDCHFLVVQGTEKKAIELARNLWGRDESRTNELFGATVVPVLTTYQAGSLYLVVPKGKEHSSVLVAVHPNSILRLGAIAGPSLDLGVKPEQITFAVEHGAGEEDFLQVRYDTAMQLLKEKLDQYVRTYSILGKHPKSINDLVQELVFTQRPADYLRSLGRIQPFEPVSDQYLGAVKVAFISSEGDTPSHDRMVLVFGVGSGEKQYGDGAGRTLTAFYRTFENTSNFVHFGATVGLLIEGNSSYVGKTVIPQNFITSDKEAFSFCSVFDVCSAENLAELGVAETDKALLLNGCATLRRELLRLGVNLTGAHWGVEAPFAETDKRLHRVIDHWDTLEITLETVDVEHLPIIRAIQRIKQEQGRHVFFNPVNVCSDSAWEGVKTVELSLGFTQPYFESQDASEWYAAFVLVQKFSSRVQRILAPLYANSFSETKTDQG